MCRVLWCLPGFHSVAWGLLGVLFPSADKVHRAVCSQTEGRITNSRQAWATR